ncbi:MAG: SDR family oxidoreductase [Deltaproteobacteria bacterium]|nr:SDR family oxidoreductase [Deltaproteobacteria bacterium]MBW2422252.1 SDR family oxidoreductase [Deltaproteobacteria bacterium]
MNPLFDLTGKVAIITGSSRGIGRAIAENMARCGARVVISSRKREACEEVAAAIREEGGQAIAQAASLSSREELEGLVARAREEWGQVDILVCNAATNPYYGPLQGLSDEMFDKMMHNNVRSNLWLCKMVLPEMGERGDGVVILISSVGGIRGNSTLGAYGITKAADMALVRNLAVEWGPQNVRVTCIAPGLIKTDFARALWENPELLAATEGMTPLGRIGTPDEIGGLAACLASPAGAFLTGQVIVVDGGMSISQGG